MCSMTKRMNRITFVTVADRQPGVQTNTSTLCTWGRLCAKTPTVPPKSNRRVLLANLRFRRHCLPPYDDQPTAQLRLEIRMLEAEVMETMSYACVVWIPTVSHLTILRTNHHRLLFRCIGRKEKPRDGYRMLSHEDALTKTGCENVETTVRKRRIRFAGFVARTGNERLLKRVMVGDLEGGKGLLRRARAGLDGLS